MIERVYYRIKLSNQEIIYSQHVNVTQSTGTSTSDTMSQKAITDELNKKFDKAGGTVSGNVNIQGNLNVQGDFHKVDTETLRVKDAIIVTNTDGEQLVEKAGIVINIGNNASYGIVYDPTKDAVVLGKGKVDETGKFAFDANEGDPVTTRDESNLLTNGHILVWDANKKKLVDSGKKVTDFEADDAISDINLTIGNITVQYDTTDGIRITSQGEVVYESGTREQATVDFDIPIIAGDGISIDKAPSGEKIVIKATAAPMAVTISAPAGAMQGTLTVAQLSTLQASTTNYIIFNNECYYLGDHGHIEGYLGYTHNGYENGKGWQKTITITVDTRSWVLTTVELNALNVVQTTGTSTTAVMSQKAVTDAITNAVNNAIKQVLNTPV